MIGCLPLAASSRCEMVCNSAPNSYVTRLPCHTNDAWLRVWLPTIACRFQVCAYECDAPGQACEKWALLKCTRNTLIFLPGRCRQSRKSGSRRHRLWRLPAIGDTAEEDVIPVCMGTSEEGVELFTLPAMSVFLAGLQFRRPALFILWHAILCGLMLILRRIEAHCGPFARLSASGWLRCAQNGN